MLKWEEFGDITQKPEEFTSSIKEEYISSFNPTKNKNFFSIEGIHTDTE